MTTLTRSELTKAQLGKILIRLDEIVTEDNNKHLSRTHQVWIGDAKAFINSVIMDL